ncbi:condensation domain-containing protein [Streptomyces netropsis]|uniref:condensation domain-containing protein n=1 Tax=Streptomyces netropsis TaxID=55404 RepID=UPI0037905E8F
MTAFQLEIWISQILEPSSTVYNVGDYYEITGAVDGALLERAARTAVDEAGSLGARFVTAPDGAPAQELASAEWDFDVLDLSGTPDPEAEALAWMRAQFDRPVDLTRGPLLAAALIKVSDDRHFWYRRFHHILLDAHSCAVLARRTADLYNSLHSGTSSSPNPFEPVTTALEHDRAYRTGRLARTDRDFWEQEATVWPVTGRLKADAPPAPVARNGEHVLPRSVIDAIHEQSERLGVSPAHFQITAAALYLWQATEAEEVTFGCSVAGRPTRKLRDVIAPMANILPMRVAVEPGRSVGDTFQQADGRIRQALRHHRYRYEEFRRALSARPDHPAQQGVGPLVNILNFDRDLHFGAAKGVVHTLVTGPIPDLGFCFDSRSGSEGTAICVEANPANYSAEETQRHADGLGLLVGELASVDPATALRALGRG